MKEERHMLKNKRVWLASFLCFCLGMGCASASAVEEEPVMISAQTAFAEISDAFASCIYQGELKYSIEQSILNNAHAVQKDDGTITLEAADGVEKLEQRNTSLLMDDTLYTRVVNLDRDNSTSDLMLLRSEPEQYYVIEGTSAKLAEAGFSQMQWNLSQAKRVDTSAMRMDPEVMLHNACFMLIGSLFEYDTDERVYTACKDEFSWSSKEEDGSISLYYESKQSAALNEDYKMEFSDIAALADTFVVKYACGTVSINEDDQQVLVDYFVNIEYSTQGKTYSLIENGKIDFMAYSYRIPSYGTINQIIDDLDFDVQSGKPKNDLETFVY
jgi:hypothetical protein